MRDLILIALGLAAGWWLGAAIRRWRERQTQGRLLKDYRSRLGTRRNGRGRPE
ncbi:hypothetical protein [Candidatus Palauibacter sp.]|uniref:hypothetical protein n=1 Tax=Candidatus Palauibacter sp. TaxID=3101350 RepID=UPI003CC57280